MIVLAVVTALTPAVAQQIPESKDTSCQNIENTIPKSKINSDKQKNSKKGKENKSEKIRRTIKRNKGKLRLLPDKTDTTLTNIYPEAKN